MKYGLKLGLEKIFLKSSLGYPVIGFLPEQFQIEVAEKYHKNKFACGLANTAFNLGFSAALIGSNYISQNYFADVDDSFVYDIFSKVVSIGTWAWGVKSCLLNATRLVWMADTRETKGELAVETGWRCGKEVSKLARIILHHADSEHLVGKE